MFHQYSEKFQKVWETMTYTNDPVSCPDSFGDTPWTLSSIGEMLTQGEHEIYSIAAKSNFSGANGLITRLGKPYLPYDKKSILPNGSSPPFLKEIISRARDPVLRACFKNTRLDRNMIRIIDDFAAEKVKPESSLYQIQRFPLILEKDSLPARQSLKEYYAEIGITGTEFEARSVRDFALNGYILTCLKNYDLSDLSVAASAICLLFCTDYLNIYDGSNFGTMDGFQATIMDSIALYGGGQYAPVMENVVLCAAFLDYKNEITAKALNNVVLPRIPASPVPTPLEYNEVRWLDAFLAIYLKFPFVLADGAGIPIDDRLNPVGTRICPLIRRCLEIYMYTNDIIDLISDFNGEPINCVAVAARYGGLNAVIGYADACATCVDDCAKCDCAAGDAAHDWAVDSTQGMLMTYQLVPRYVAMTQMVELGHLTGQMYQDLLNSAQHGAFTSGKVAKFRSNEPALHDTDWKPLFELKAVPPYVGSGECSHCQTITTWLVNRGLYRERRNLLEKQVGVFVKEHVHLNPNPEMKNFWGELLLLLAGEEHPTEIVQECARVVESTWNLLRFAGESKADVNLVRKRQIRLYFDVCKVMTRTHEFQNGHHVRRAVVGLISVMGDRTDVSVFQRILDGLLEYSG